jgi:hypothetical protein
MMEYNLIAQTNTAELFGKPPVKSSKVLIEAQRRATCESEVGETRKR